MNDFTFRITPRRQLASLSWMLSVWGIIFSIYLYYYGFTLPRIYFFIFLVCFTFDILPTIIVHIQYLIINRGATFVINKGTKILEYSSRKENRKYYFDDIVSFQHVASYGSGSWYSFAEYRYFRFTFKDEGQIIVTCLMVKEIKYVLEMLLAINAEKKLRPVAFIY